MGRPAKLALIPVGLYATWLGMMLLHELGHVVHARLAGAVVTHVDIPLFGFSETHIGENPHPLFVTWGGPLWGAMLPLAVWLVMHRLGLRGEWVARFFAGFCLIANAVYIGVGWLLDAGDAADMRDMEMPVWVMAGFGLAGTCAGLWLWHGLGSFLPKRAQIA